MGPFSYTSLPIWCYVRFYRENFLLLVSKLIGKVTYMVMLFFDFVIQYCVPPCGLNALFYLNLDGQVARATAAKAKQLLREVKTLKADLAFAKERCSQLEDENRVLREAHEKGDYPADDDMVFFYFLSTITIFNWFFTFHCVAKLSWSKFESLTS